jgi:hypothetical protein
MACRNPCPAEAVARNMIHVDATCPLVTKVHNEAARHSEQGRQLIMIGHEGHPETVGTMGQLPPGEVLLVETVEDVAGLQVRDPERLAYMPCGAAVSPPVLMPSCRRSTPRSGLTSGFTRRTSGQPGPCRHAGGHGHPDQ